MYDLCSAVAHNRKRRMEYLRVMGCNNFDNLESTIYIKIIEQITKIANDQRTLEQKTPNYIVKRVN